MKLKLKETNTKRLSKHHPVIYSHFTWKPAEEAWDRCLGTHHYAAILFPQMFQNRERFGSRRAGVVRKLASSFPTLGQSAIVCEAFFPVYGSTAFSDKSGGTLVHFLWEMQEFTEQNRGVFFGGEGIKECA